MSVKEWPKILNKIGNKCKVINPNLHLLMKNSFLELKAKWPKIYLMELFMVTYL